MKLIGRADLDRSSELIERGLSTNRPTNPIAGRTRYETDTGEYVGYTGSTWDAIDGNVASADVSDIVALSQAAYDALSPPDPTTLYLII